MIPITEIHPMIEDYISRHSPVRFSHSICPDCRQRLYPEIDDHS